MNYQHVQRCKGYSGVMAVGFPSQLDADRLLGVKCFFVGGQKIRPKSLEEHQVTPPPAVCWIPTADPTPIPDRVSHLVLRRKSQLPDGSQRPALSLPVSLPWTRSPSGQNIG